MIKNKTALLVAGLFLLSCFPDSFAIGPIITAGSGANFPNKAWVDAVSGSDTTGQLQREDKPYATVAAAFAAAAAATGNWIVKVMPGSYTDTGLVPHGSNYNIATEWAAGCTWTVTSSGFLYDLTGVTFAKPLWILGNGKFYGSNTQTGGFIKSTFGTTALDYFEIEADRIEPGTAVTTFFDLRGTINSADPQNSSLGPRSTIKCRTVFGHASAFSYFRIIGTGASPFILIEGIYVQGLNLDEGNFIVRAALAEAFKLGTNAFGNPALQLHCVYRFKGTSQPALEARRGHAIISAPNLEVTDGAAPIIKITSIADTTDGVKIHVIDGRFKQWAGGNSPAILFDAVHANYKLRLVNCEFLIANTATTAIATTGSNAQTIEAIGSLTSNLALDADITVRGAPVTIDTNLWTDF